MIERFDRRIAAILATAHFDSAEHFVDTSKGHVQSYNQHIFQKPLGYIPPSQAILSVGA